MDFNYGVGEMMFNKKKKESLEENFLLYKPLRKIQNWEANDEKVKLIFEHNKPIERFIRRFTKKSEFRDIELDEMGSLVWKLCDGHKTVYDIALDMVKKFDDSEQNAIDRLIIFLKYLSRKEWITFEK